MSITQTTFPNYYEKAVNQWPWSKMHPEAHRINSYKLTIPQVLEYRYEDDNMVQFFLSPKGLFNEETLSRKFYEGPYIDIVKTSFKSLNEKCEFIIDSAPATEIETFTEELSQTNHIGVRATVGIANGKSGIDANADGSRNTTKGSRKQVSELTAIRTQSDQKMKLSITLNTCYTHSAKQPRDYKIDDLSTMRSDRFGRRCSLVGGLLTEWFDVVRDTPKCARSSVCSKWSLKYAFKHVLSQRFKWSTKVRTIVASNDVGVSNQGPFRCGEYLNVIISDHKISQIFQVNIINGNIIEVRPQTTKIKKICSSGYERTIVRKFVETFILNENKKLTSIFEEKKNYPNGNKYKGVLVKGQPEGFGVLIYESKDRYEGNFVNGKFEGKGILTLMNGDTYEGNFVNDKFEGKGTYKFADTSMYEGDFVNGTRHGKGKYMYADKSIYVGDYVNGTREGKGTYTYADRSRYEGDFVNGKFKGKGTLTLADGRVFKGDFANDTYLGLSVT